MENPAPLFLFETKIFLSEMKWRTKEEEDEEEEEAEDKRFIFMTASPHWQGGEDDTDTGAGGRLAFPSVLKPLKQ